MAKQIELRRQENKEYEVFQNGSSIGFVSWSKNHFHNQNLYFELKLHSYDKGISEELFALLQHGHKEPFQIMCDSTEKELIDFIEAAGFVCKRRCYECEVTKAELKAESQSEVPLFFVKYPEKEYLEASKLLYQQYVEKHAAINPMTVEFEGFTEILPKEAYVELKEGNIANFAFIEENEIAYVGSVSRETYKNFILAVATRLFREYETICFECDDTDWEAMQLKELFVTDSDESYNTYILERTTE